MILLVWREAKHSRQRGLRFNANNIIMTANDGILLVKKIVIGVVVTVVPFAILFGGLVLLQNILQ